MEIVFKTNKLEKILTSEKQATKEYGPEHAKKILHRMTELAAFENLGDVPTYKPMRCHELSNNRKNQFAITSKEPYRIIFIPDYQQIPMNEFGGIAKDKITRIKILEVSNHYE